MIRTVYLFALLLFLTALAPGGLVSTALAQQDPQFSMYMYNPLYYNPAAAGSEGVSRLQITQRTQYLGYQPTIASDGGAQNTQLLSFNMPLAKIKSGVGIYAFNDKLGAVLNQAVQVSYAYRMSLKNGTLALGVQAGMYNRGINYGELFRPGQPGDPSIPTGQVSQAKPDFSAGIYYNTTDYWFGVSMTHLNGATYALVTDRSTDPLDRTANLTAGYRLGLGYNIDVQPSILVQYSTGGRVKASTITANVVGTYDNRIWAGVGYRLGDAVMATAGINLMRNNALRVGYALDLVTGGTQVKSLTSHEILLAYALPALDARKKPIVRTPRFRY
jgi:type IX secretion system PorP/SprF family membrane protein